MTFRTHRGYIDDGHRVNPGSRCPNCKSARYHESISREACSDCGLEFNYWSVGGVSGGNDVYKRYEDRKRQEEIEADFQAELKREQEARDEYNSWWLEEDR